MVSCRLPSQLPRGSLTTESLTGNQGGKDLVYPPRPCYKPGCPGPVGQKLVLSTNLLPLLVCSSPPRPVSINKN